jgi:hypothetical protein
VDRPAAHRGGQFLDRPGGEPEPGRRDGVLADQAGQHRQTHRPRQHRQRDHDPDDDPAVAVPDLVVPFAEPSWNQPAAHTFFPVR